MLGLNYDREMTGGYYNLQSLASIKGFHNHLGVSRLENFAVHYAIFYNIDETGKKFYRCEKRKD